MPMTRAEERLARKAAIELNYFTEAHNLPKDRASPSGCGPLNGPERSAASPKLVETPCPSPQSGTTFSSVELWMRRPSVISYSTADAFQGAEVLGPGDLCNPIHPIFRKSNLHGEAKQWYDALAPALQLASRFLTTDSLLPFWYAMYFGEIRLLEDAWHSSPHHSKSYELLDVPEQLTPSQTRKVHRALLSLANRVRFTIYTGIDPEVEEGDSFTYKRRSKAHGRVFLSRVLFRRLRTAAAAGDRPTWTWTTFSLARNLCHELAHAADQILHGDRARIYFPGNIASEPGFEWERRVLGGLVTAELDDAAAPGAPLKLWLMKWPNPVTVALYMGGSAQFGLRVRPDPSEISPAESVPVAPELVERVFEERFWAEEVAQRGPAALHLPWDEEKERLRRLPAKGTALLRAMCEADIKKEKRHGGYFGGIDLGLRHCCCGASDVGRRWSTGDLELPGMDPQEPPSRTGAGWAAESGGRRLSL